MSVDHCIKAYKGEVWLPGCQYTSYGDFERAKEECSKNIDGIKNKIRQICICTPKDVFPSDSEGDTLWKLNSEVDELFDEIKQYKSYCKFSDCLHDKEAGCAVIEHIENIDLSRYQSYLSFVNEAKEYKERVKISGTKHERETNFKHHNDKMTVKISAQKRQSARNTLKQNISKEIHEDK